MEERYFVVRRLLIMSRESGYATQNPLFCNDNHLVLPMTLSNLYALAPYASHMYACTVPDELLNKSEV